MTTLPAGPSRMVDIDHLPVPAAVVDVDERLVGVNAAMADLVGGDDTHQLLSDLHDCELWSAVAEMLARPVIVAER